MSTVSATNDSPTPTKRTAVTEELTTAICADYQSGNFTQAEVAAKHSISLPTVNRLIKSSGAKPERRKYTHKTSKFADRNAQVLTKAQGGASTRELATEFGVTHQNISLILKKANFIPIAAHKERLAVKSAARAKRVSALKVEKTEKKMANINALSALWKSGAKIGEIRESAGLKSDNAAQVKIVLLRRKYPDLFPKRPAFGRTALLSIEKLAKVVALSTAWIGGKSVAECAAVVGWTPATVSRTVPHLRKTFGTDKFPYRRQPAAEKPAVEDQDIPDFTAPVA